MSKSFKSVFSFFISSTTFAETLKPPELPLCTALTLDIPAWLTTYLIRLNASVPTPRRSPGIVNVSNNSRHAFDPALVCEEGNVNLLKASSDADALARAACGLTKEARMVLFRPVWQRRRQMTFPFHPALLWAPFRCLTYHKAHLHLLFFLCGRGVAAPSWHWKLECAGTGRHRQPSVCSGGVTASPRLHTFQPAERDSCWCFSVSMSVQDVTACTCICLCSTFLFFLTLKGKFYRNLPKKGQSILGVVMICQSVHRQYRL